MHLFQKLLFMAFALFLISGTAYAMTSTNYQIPWDNVNTGGFDFATSTNYSLNDTVGDISGVGTSTNYTLSAGYRVAELAAILSVTIRSQNTAVQTAFTAFNNAGNTVTVASTVGFSVGDLISVVENQGFAELVAIGKITDISGTTITVDNWDGEPTSLSPVPAGGDDFVFLMDANAINLGSVTSTEENVALAVTSIQTDAANGFTVYIQPNQLLQNASSTVITSVTDGAVSLSSEEYGAENIGVTALNTGSDLGVTSTQRAIQTSGTNTGAVSDKMATLYKLAITDATQSGTYTQTIFYTLTANF